MTPRRPLARPRLEPLDPRDVPADLTVTFAAASHTLTIVGTDSANNLSVTGDPNDQTHFQLDSGTDTFNGSVAQLGIAAPLASNGPNQSIAIFSTTGSRTKVTAKTAASSAFAAKLTSDGGR